jgi:hypothetical protein
MKPRKLLFEGLEVRTLLSAVPQEIPYIQNFDTQPTDGWTYQTNGGYIGVENNQLQMGDLRSHRGYALNTAILHVNLKDKTDVQLSFNHIIQKDELHAQDGVFVSDDGETWHRVPFNLSSNSSARVKLDTLSATLVEDYQIKFQQYDNWSWTSGVDGRAWREIKIEEVLPVVPQEFPYKQEFATLPTTSEGWEIITDGGTTHIEDGKLVMGDVVGHKGYATNTAILHVNLQGQENVGLTFYHMSQKDEIHDKDGIWVSNDGKNWKQVPFSLYTRGTMTVNLDDIGIGYTNDFQIKFQQYDNWSWESGVDGRAWDNVELATYVAPDPTVCTITTEDLNQKKIDIGRVVGQYGFTGTVIAQQCDQILHLSAKGGRGVDSVYGLASVSKQFTAAAILRAEELGLLKITPSIHRLLTHTSGGGFAYSNGGYQQLRAILSRATGGKPNTFVQRELLDKAGMTNSTARYWSGDGGIRSTARDMVKWHEALMDDTVLNAASRAKMFTRHVSNGYGYGIYVSSTGRTQMHSGSWAGEISWSYRFPEQGRDGMFIILTRGGVSYSLVSKLRNIMLA